MSLNDKNNFLNKLEKFDNFYLPYNGMKSYIDKHIRDQNFTTYKEYFSNSEPSYLSSVNLRYIREITLNTQESENPFKIFYNLDEACIKDMFYLLAKTHRALRYFNEYSSPMKDLEQRNSKKNITNKIQAVLTILKETDKEINEHFEKIINNAEIDARFIPDGYRAYTYLVGLKNSLENNHYTERHVLENLLFEMYSLLKEQQLSKEQIFRTVNSIISIYFGIIKDDDKPYFTTKMNLTKFKALNYQYETRAGIDLTHSIPSKQKKSV